MPNLVPVVDSLDQVPEAARPFYEAKDGKFVISLNGSPQGFVPAADLATAHGKVVEFRDTNIALTKEVEQLRPLKTQFEGIDPVAAKAALTAQAALEKKGVKNADDVSSLVTTAVEAALKPVKEQLIAAQEASQANQKRADDAVLRTTISEKFLKAGGKPKAVDFVVGQALTAFEVKNGVVAALANKFSAEKPGEALGVDEWLVGVAKEHDFVFEASSGSGAAPVKGGSAPKPGQTILRDPTPQQLGDASGDILKGKVRVEYSK